MGDELRADIGEIADELWTLLVWNEFEDITPVIHTETITYADVKARLGDPFSFRWVYEAR